MHLRAMLARKPATPPPVPVREGFAPHLRHILFRHPLYDDSCNVLLKLFAPDLPDRGLHAEYALVACGIIAGNRWDGWLSETREGSPQASPTAILDKASYYFHLPPSSNHPTAPCPIVPTFREWPFPHDRLPSSWTQTAPRDAADQTFSTSGLTSALQQRDLSCRISGCKEGTQAAHICPQSESEWYRLNGMSRYNASNTSSVDDPSNALLLRADLHIAFDKPKFVFVPKPSSDPQCPQKFVAHLVEPSRELEFLYHNRAMQSLCVSVELLFARFAWTIFPWLDGFLTNGVPRRIMTSRIGADDSVDGNMPPSFTSAEQCAQYGLKASRSRNPSPKKRGRPDVEIADTVEVLTCSLDEDSRPIKRYRPHMTIDNSEASCGALDTSFDSLDQALPATPEQLPPSPQHAIAPSAALKQLWLQQERVRSDPEKTWERELLWGKDVYEGNVTLGEADGKRWLAFNGGEFQE